MIKVGITGGIGSGKSTVCRLFSLLGVPVYDSDTEARRLMNTDPAVIGKIRELLGSAAYRDGVLDRRAVVAQIFGNCHLRERLNRIVHPAVAVDFMRWAGRQTGHYVIQEAAVLFESGADRLMDATVEVAAPEALRIRRTCRRDGTDEASVRARIAAQLSEEERIARADHVIVSDDRTLVIPQVLKLHELFGQL